MAVKEVERKSRHVLREQNRVANRMAKMTIDLGSNWMAFVNPPQVFKAY